MAWRQNASRRRSGKIRVVPEDRLPRNPNTSWDELSEALERDQVREEPRGTPGSTPDYCTKAQEFLEARD